MQEHIEYKEVRILIADNGKGIHESLTKHPNSNYRGLTEGEAVFRCIENRVTNSTGKGFGLWATAEMIGENGGELIIHSGNHQLICFSEKRLEETVRWQGTYTFLRINTDIPVDYKVIFGEDSDRADLFEEFKEKLLGISDELW